jgi:hypothetical protein
VTTDVRNKSNLVEIAILLNVNVFKVTLKVIYLAIFELTLF